MRVAFAGWFFTLLPIVALLGAGCRHGALSDTAAPFGAVSDTPGSIDDLDAVGGFRDLQFGSGVTRDMEPAEKQDAQVTASYVRKNEDSTLGAAEVKVIRYIYFQNGLASVIIETGDRKNSQALLDLLWKSFGGNVNRQAPVQVWNGKKNVAHFTIEPPGKGRLTIWNREMIAKAVKENVARAAATRAADN